MTPWKQRHYRSIYEWSPYGVSLDLHETHNTTLHIHIIIVKFLTVNLLAGLVWTMPRINSWAGEGTNDGILNSPRLTFSNNTLRLSSSNGRAPYTHCVQAHHWQHVHSNTSDTHYYYIIVLIILDIIVYTTKVS